MNGIDNTASNQQLETLLEKCAQSNEIALSDLFNLTSAKLFAVQEHMLGNNMDAERALHATYSEIWVEASNYSSKMGLPMNWLTGIARQQALRVLGERQENAHQPVAGSGALSDPDKYADLDFLTANATSDNTAAQALSAGLNQLESVPRDCITRAYLDGSSVLDLSELHRIPEDEVRSWLQQGMLSLRGHINGLA